MRRFKLPIILLLAILTISPLIANFSPNEEVLAQDDSRLEIAGLEAPVTVIYDNMGIPHIYAENTHDLFMAQGYVHATHRWWQMEWWRHLSAGRLSEIAGQPTAGTDSFLRTLDYAGAADRDLEVISDEALAIAEAYTAGVNAFIDTTDRGDMAVEYDFLLQGGVDLEVEAWTVNDSMRWLKVMALSLSGNFELEIFKDQVTQALGRIGALAIFPNYPYDDHPVIIEPGGIDYTGMDVSYPTVDGEITVQNTNLEPVNLIGNASLHDPNVNPLGYGMGIGSNSWVIGGDLADSGMPMVVNDPHLGIQMPSIWYEVGLHCVEVNEACPYDVVGVSFAGVPAVVIGHNANVAWAFTNVGTDVQDLYTLTINPDNEDQYMLDGEWVDFDITTETITVSGGDDIELTIRNSVWGPVITQFLPVEGVTYSLRWTALDAVRTFDAILGFNTSSNAEEFREASRFFDVPAQNLVFADVDGNIAYQMPGKTPIRADGHDGDLPIDGSTTDNEWQGYIPFEELPFIMNPDAGYIVTANNTVVPRDYPYYITAQWDYGFRGRRIEEMIQNDEDGVYTIEDMQRIHGDNYDYRADIVLPALNNLDLEGDLADLVSWMGEWDRQADMDSSHAAFMNMYWRELMRLSAGDELGFIPNGNDQYMLLVRGFLATDGHPLWDNQLTSDVQEGRDDILAQALQVAWENMVADYGDDRDTWSWGEMHLACFRAAPLGQGVDPQLDPLLQSLFNRCAPASGGGEMVNATGYPLADSFELSSLPSMRQITVVGDWDSSLRINTNGQSGRPDSRHYDDQIDMWRNIQYHPEWFSREAVEADASAMWELVPAE